MGRKILFIRHGKTRGNLEQRYVGRTDESLCREGREELQRNRSLYPSMPGAMLLASPLKRCIETAELLFPDESICMKLNLRECDFGEFEYRNYKELSGNVNYQSWVDSGGTSGFPEGEKPLEFKKRCVKAYEEVILATEKPLIFVVHGGTIMAILEKYSVEQKDYYSWQIKNGEAYLCELQDGFYLKVLEYFK